MLYLIPRAFWVKHKWKERDIPCAFGVKHKWEEGDTEGIWFICSCSLALRDLGIPSQKLSFPYHVECLKAAERKAVTDGDSNGVGYHRKPNPCNVDRTSNASKCNPPIHSNANALNTKVVEP